MTGTKYGKGPSLSAILAARGAEAAEAQAEARAEMTLAELQAEAEARGLPTSGTKAELQARLAAGDG